MKHLACLSMLSLLFSCTPGGGGGPGASGASSSPFSFSSSSSSSLNEQKMTRYLQLYNRLKADAPGALELVNEHDPAAAQHAQFGTLQKGVADGGMKYAEFVDLSSRIGTIYSVSEATMASYENMSGQNLKQMDDMTKSIQAMIDDPDIPESKKAEFRAALATTQRGKDQLGSMWRRNKPKAKKMYARIRKRLRKFASDDEIQLVDKYRKQLESAFKGVSRPRIQGSI